MRRGSGTGVLIGVLLGAALWGCTLPNRPVGPPPAEHASVPPPEATPPPVPKRPAARKPAPKPKVGAQARAEVPKDRPHPKPELDPKILVGRNENELIDLLGKPQSVRNEPPAMVWQYAGTGCKLDVFFYFDMGNQDFRSLAYKFYRDGGTRDDNLTCLASLRNGQVSRAN